MNPGILIGKNRHVSLQYRDSNTILLAILGMSNALAVWMHMQNLFFFGKKRLLRWSDDWVFCKQVKIRQLLSNWVLWHRGAFHNFSLGFLQTAVQKSTIFKSFQGNTVWFKDWASIIKMNRPGARMQGHLTVSSQRMFVDLSHTPLLCQIIRAMCNVPIQLIATLSSQNRVKMCQGHLRKFPSIDSNLWTCFLPLVRCPLWPFHEKLIYGPI